MFRNGPMPPIIFEIELVDNGETIDQYPYPIVPEVNDTIKINESKSFLVKDRTFKTYSEGSMLTPVFKVKLNGKLTTVEIEKPETTETT